MRMRLFLPPSFKLDMEEQLAEISRYYIASLCISRWANNDRFPTEKKKREVYVSVVRHDNHLLSTLSPSRLSSTKPTSNFPKKKKGLLTIDFAIQIWLGSMLKYVIAGLLNTPSPAPLAAIRKSSCFWKLPKYDTSVLHLSKVDTRW